MYDGLLNPPPPQEKKNKKKLAKGSFLDSFFYTCNEFLSLIQNGDSLSMQQLRMVMGLWSVAEHLNIFKYRIGAFSVIYHEYSDSHLLHRCHE